ncbi:hypothetical protein DSO57_1024743 [Entomophthora muscae]|uniref:Uncharacterized protein n=1 Tax=Entomophthora muscae TaxID=34485 RepID=A0ACC2UNV7_9FUNG|nr:hypothetical protein DSO57_1024743 [Entomophthora muscae]
MIPVLVLLWKNSPEIWESLPSTVTSLHVTPQQLPYALDDLPGQACALLATIRSLTSDSKPLSIAVKVAPPSHVVTMAPLEPSSPKLTPLSGYQFLVGTLLYVGRGATSPNYSAHYRMGST